MQIIIFLNLKLTIEDDKIQTTFYSKPTDTHLYLQADSCHHFRSNLGIQTGVALRFCRICSTNEEYSSK